MDQRGPRRSVISPRLLYKCFEYTDKVNTQKDPYEMADTVQSSSNSKLEAPETPPSAVSETANQSSGVDLEKIAAPEEPVRNVHGFKVDNTAGSAYL